MHVIVTPTHHFNLHMHYNTFTPHYNTCMHFNLHSSLNMHAIITPTHHFNLHSSLNMYALQHFYTYTHSTFMHYNTFTPHYNTSTYTDHSTYNTFTPHYNTFISITPKRAPSGTLKKPLNALSGLLCGRP